MPKKYPRRPIATLLSLTIEYILANVEDFKESFKYLPAPVKDRILRKLQTGNTYLKSLLNNKTLANLVHPHVRSINLSALTIDDNTLSIFEMCHRLAQIDLRYSEKHNITNKGLINLFKHTKNLLILDVARCEVFDDDVLECVALNCPKLCELCADSCDVTDYGFITLTKNVKKLKCLTISGTKVTGNGVIHAVENKFCWNLQELRLDNCSKINDDVLKLILRYCPKIEILTFYNCSITDETSIFQDIRTTCKNLKQLHWTIMW